MPKKTRREKIATQLRKHHTIQELQVAPPTSFQHNAVSISEAKNHVVERPLHGNKKTLFDSSTVVFKHDLKKSLFISATLIALQVCIYIAQYKGMTINTFLPF